MHILDGLKDKGRRLFAHLTRPRPLSAVQVYMFTVYLHTMIRSGMGLVPSLHVLSSNGEFSHCADGLLRDVESGMKLSRALSRQPESFPQSYCRIVETSEATGKIEDCLGAMASTLDKQNQTSKRFASAMVYPAFLIVSSMTLIFVMLYFIFPMIIKVTGDAGVDPPGLTKAMITLTTPRVLLSSLAVFLLGSLSAFGLWKHPRTGPTLRYVVERFTPPGRYFVQIQVLRSVRQLALMLESGVDLLRALNYASRVGESSVLVKQAFKGCVAHVREGESLGASLAYFPVFPKILVAMVSIADFSGDIQSMLHRFCDVLEDNLNSRMEALTSIVEPLLLGAMGVIIGTILVAAFLPIYNLVKL